MLSVSFKIAGKMEIGLVSAGPLVTLLFGMGVTNACFQAAGTEAVTRLEFMTSNKGKPMPKKNFWRRSMLMPSMPNDLDLFICAKVMQRVSKSIGITLKEQVMTRGSSVGSGAAGGGTLAAVCCPTDA